MAASAQKLDSDRFNVSWGPINSAATNGHVAVTNLPDVFESCNLSYNISKKKINLVLDCVLSKTLKLTKRELYLVFANKDGIKQKMTLSQTKWTASWSWKAPVALAGRGYFYPKETNKTIVFDILIHLTPSLTMTKGAKHVLDHISNLWKTKTLSDIIFKCQGKQIKAHAMIVASCSPVLATMFNNDFKENREKVVDIQEITHGTFSRLLRFMYTGDASLNSNVSEKEITELLMAADKYGVETLKEDCALHLSCNLKVENVSRLLVLAHLLNSSILLESTFEFISKNAKAVCSRKDWMEIIKNYPELCFQATQLMFDL